MPSRRLFGTAAPPAPAPSAAATYGGCGAAPSAAAVVSSAAPGPSQALPAASTAAQLGGEVMAAAKAKEEKRARKVWLHAWYDPVAGLRAHNACCRLADLNGDGDSKLLVASADKKLKIYKGTALLSENILLDVPVAICAFYPEVQRGNARNAPSVAVASGSFIFIYRNLRPYYKFTLPELPVEQREEEAWEGLAAGQVDLGGVRDLLTAVRDAGLPLCARSHELLAIEDVDEAEAFCAQHLGTPLVRQTAVTCMETLRKSLTEDDAQSMLVVGTESGAVLFLEPSGAAVLKMLQLPAAPAFIACTGLYTVEFRVTCACRDGRVYSIKNGQLSGTILELESMPCGLVRISNQVVVGCMSSSIHAFHLKGKKNYSIYLPAPIQTMELLELRRIGSTRALLAGLQSGEVRLYNDKHLLASLQMEEPITALRFGAYGREESALALVGQSGALSIKMMQRKVELESGGGASGPPPEQDVPLAIPKKTKLYVEQTQREREQATEIHRLFQRDLCKLRLTTARSYVKLLSDGQGSLSYSAGSSLRLTAQVQGLGPRFKVKLSLQNVGQVTVPNLSASFTYNATLYRIKQSIIKVPVLVPGVLFRVDAELECIDVNGGADTVKVVISSAGSSLPVLSAVVNMPPSEVLLKDLGGGG